MMQSKYLHNHCHLFKSVLLVRLSDVVRPTLPCFITAPSANILQSSKERGQEFEKSLQTIYRGFLEGQEEDEAASLRVGIVPRMPVAWLLLKPARGRPNAPLIPLAVPLAADSSLPDYVVRADVYDKGMQRIWSCHDRFRMFFGGKSGHKAGALFALSTHYLLPESDDCVCVFSKSEASVWAVHLTTLCKSDLLDLKALGSALVRIKIAAIA